MKYSLRSLFFATTVIAAVLGRMHYLHCQAQYHDRNFERVIAYPRSCKSLLAA
jgi:hypothetical protein